MIWSTLWRRPLARKRWCGGFAGDPRPALRDRSDIRLEFWQPSGAYKATVEYPETVRTRESTRTQTVKGAVIPDGHFALKHGDAAAYFFLEADRSKMSNPRFLEKCQAY